MSKRSERREAERTARKLAYQQLRQQPPQSSAVQAEAAPESNPLAAAQAFFENQPEPVAASEPTSRTEPEMNPDTQPGQSQSKPISEAQLAANRANAQFSTGAKTAEGQARSARNALKHGLTSHTVLLPYEDAEAYHQQLDSYIDDCKPATDEERRLLQSMVDCDWRLSRLQRLETSILLKGHLEFAKQFQEHSPVERAHLINAEAYLKYERQLRNLNIQEARLLRTREKDRAALTHLQIIRRQEERAAAQQAQKPEPPSRNGFEFSTPAQAQAKAPPSGRNQRKQAA